MINKARNHHYIAQVEQRLNAINPDILKEKQKIYSFSVVDREKYEISLNHTNGIKIKDNLSDDDLFSFDVVDDSFRMNLEDAFGKYERSVGHFTESLLQKINNDNLDLTEEILSIFALKVLNTFRNPYCIKKTLNTIGELAFYQPAEKELQAIYKKIDDGIAPHKETIASKYSVSVEEYTQWIKSLFMLLIPSINQDMNALEIITKSFFENTDSFITVCVSIYNDEHFDKHVVLSDRGFSVLSNDDVNTSYEFNLTSNAFITYVFTDIRKIMASKNIDEKQIELILASRESTKSKIEIDVKYNDLEILSRYNRNAIYQSFDTVYCKSNQVYTL